MLWWKLHNTGDSRCVWVALEWCFCVIVAQFSNSAVQADAGAGLLLIQGGLNGGWGDGDCEMKSFAVINPAHGTHVHP